MNPKPKILYVEDEEDYRILVTDILEAEGFAVQAVETGEEGLIALQNTRPDLLILDINLPDTTGYELCTQLRRQATWMDLPILMLTVRRRPEEWLQGFSCGADDYLAKPINPPDLIDRVRTCLDGRQESQLPETSPEFPLIEAAKSGNRHAFDVLIQQYRDRLTEGLRPFLRQSADLEDIISSAFSVAFTNLARFRGESSFYTWLYRIAVNEKNYFYRHERSVSMDAYQQDNESYMPPELIDTASVADSMLKEDEQSQTAYALEQLPVPLRQILVDHVVNGFSYESLAKKFKIPQGTVMSRLFNARRLFQKHWKSSKPVSTAE